MTKIYPSTQQANIEAADPELVADLVIADADPYETIAQVARDHDVSPYVAKALVDALRARHGALIQEVQDLDGRDLADKMEAIAHVAVDSIDEASLLKVNAKDRALVAAIMVDKAQLLKGRPTQILSREDRMKMPDIVKELYKEFDRRSITVEVEEVESIVVSEPSAEYKTRPHIGNRGIEEIKHIKRLDEMDDSGEPME